MKKLITVIILATLLMMMVSSALVVSAEGETPTEEIIVGSTTEEPTAEPTEEPTVEPTEEPTVEPTEEPTVEPTEEPTVEPTVEPTEEPTVEPTEEPTVEPTEEPTVEPTEEPTLEPTATDTPVPTVEPTATVTPTVEATPTLTPTVSAGGEVGPQAVVGSWTTEIIGIQNLGSGEAHPRLDLFQGSASPVNSIDRTIPVGGNATISSAAFNNGRYSGLISSEVLVAAAALHTNYTYKVADANLGFNSVSTRNTLPAIYRGHSYWQSKFHIQNASANQQTVTVNVYLHGESTPRASPTYPIPGNSSITVDLMDGAFGAFGSGNGAYGYAVIVGTDNLAVVCDSVKDPNTGVNNTVEMMYDGFTDAVAGRNLIVPVAYNDHSYWRTGINYANIGGTATTLNFTYNVAPEYGGGVYYASQVVQPYEMGALVLFETPGWPHPSYGAVTVNSTASDIVAVTTHTKYWGGAVGFMGPAMNPNLATTKVAVPLAFQQGESAWRTGINVYSIGTGDIETRWVRADVNPTGNTFTYTKAGTNGGVTAFVAAELAGMPSDFTGATYVEAKGAGQRIMVFVTHTRYSSGIAATMPGYNYE